jgi:RNA polymerase sigma-70 factor (ECF subfamily)
LIRITLKDAERNMTHDQFNDLIIRYQKPIISGIHKMIYSWEVSRDLAQESFFKLWNMRNKIKRNKPVFTLLFRIAINLSIDHLRKGSNLSLQPFPEDIRISDNQHGDPEFRDILLTCCSKLNPRQRAVFNLRDLDGFTFEEISDILEISVGNVRSNLHLARKNIKQTLFELYQIDQEYFNEM